MTTHRQNEGAMTVLLETADEFWYVSWLVFRWIRSIGALGFILGLTCGVMMLTGIFQIVSYGKLTGFIQCQATYNQQSAVARDARIGVTDKETNLLFVALRDNITAAHQIESLPPKQRQAAAARIQKRLLREFHAAVKAHEDRLVNAKRHPYPPNPETTCGNY
jgi:hypothetical protein